MTGEVWSVRYSWSELRQAGERTLVADEATRARIARFLSLEALGSVVATLTHEAWLDGVAIGARVEAAATRLCGISLEPFEERIDTSVQLRLVPEGSRNAPAAESELIVRLDAEDPPEVVEGEHVEVANYVIEALSLALDPFPRKTGAVFDYADSKEDVSPFAVLKFPKPET